jgi:hypothetical protein
MYLGLTEIKERLYYSMTNMPITETSWISDLLNSLCNLF